MAYTDKPTITTRLLAWLQHAFIENLGLKLFSLLIALLLWLFVMGVEDVTTTQEIPVYFKLPEDKVLVSDVPSSINLTVTGPAAMRNWSTKLNQKDIDLSQYDLGPSVLYFDEGSFNLPPSLRVLRINPNQWTISLAKKTTKIVPVIPVHMGRPANGYAVKSVTANPPEIEIEGAESDVLIVDEIITEEVDISGRREDFTASTVPVRLSKNIAFSSREPILVTFIIKKDLMEREFKLIKVEVRNSSHPTRVEPEEIAISIMGPRKTVQEMQISEIKAYVDATQEEGDVPNTITQREISFDPLPQDIKIKAGSYTVKLHILEGERLQPKRKIPPDIKRRSP